MSNEEEQFEALADTLGEASFAYNEFDPSGEAETCVKRGTSVDAIAEYILAAGYRKIFDGDCGLSNVKDPTDREAAEAWMRWANLVSDEEPDGIAAMKQMLTELGYRKPRTITSLEELKTLEDPVTILMDYCGHPYQWGESSDGSEGWMAPHDRTPITSNHLWRFTPLTVLHEPGAGS